MRALLRIPPLEAAILAIAIGVLVVVGTLRPASAPAGPGLDSYSTYDTAGGGYRAFYTLLDREGIRTERFVERPAQLDTDVETLVYAEPLTFDPRAAQPTAGDIDALETWVRAGGRFVYIGHDDVAAKAGILHLPATRAAAAVRHAPAIAAELQRFGVARIRSANARRWVRRRGLDVLLDDGRGPLVVRYADGRGIVTASIDETLFRNAGIAKEDRARLAYALTRPGDPARALAFDETVHGYGMSLPWWRLVPRLFAVALGAAVVAFLVAIAGAAIRFGPPIVVAERLDRTSADFIDAVAALYDRGNAATEALASAATSTAHLLARTLALPAQTEPRDVAARIDDARARADFLTLSALAARADLRDSDVVHGVALAQTLRKEYAAYGRPRS